MIDFNFNEALAEQYLTELMVLVTDQYKATFDEPAPTMQIPGSAEDVIALLQAAILRGTPLDDDEVLNDPDVLY